MGLILKLHFAVSYNIIQFLKKQLSCRRVTVQCHFKCLYIVVDNELAELFATSVTVMFKCCKLT